MKLTSFSQILRVLLLATLASSLHGQGDLLTVAPPARVAGKAGEQLTAKTAVRLRSGYHVNSNEPNEDYLIPLRLSWEGGPLEVVEVIYPKPREEKYEFSEKPLSVYTGDFEILTRFKIGPAAPKGPGILSGKVRYQACTNNMCFPPKTVEVRLTYEIN
jgi:hypothetical protein